VGAALGAILVSFGKTYFTGALPEYWLFALGALFVIVTLFLPKGIIGTLGEMWARHRTSPPKPSDKPSNMPAAAE
jgi:urea transport system permease protein